MNQLPELIAKPKGNTGVLQLSPITLKEDYCKKWNVDCNDFVCLSRDGELVNYHILRVGGLGTPDVAKDKYFMLLKYNEAYYEVDKTKKAHLAGCWTIFDNQGNIKFEAKQFASPYIVKDSCIYYMDSNYYNIETGELYCNAFNKCESANYLFLENPYDKDKSKVGVMKINKSDGSYEIL